MTPCSRFEEEGLLRLEQGLPLDEHFATCPDCLAERAVYERLGQEIAAAGDGIEPPLGWQAGVWAAIEERKAARRRWRLLWLLVPAAAAVLVAVLLLRPPAPSPSGPTLVAEVEAGTGTVRRGDDVHPGDRLRLRASTGGAAQAELRVYRHERALVLRCSTEPPCRRGRDTLEAELLLPSIGSYQTLLLTSDRSLPEAGAGLDADVDTALAAGAQATLGREIEVR